MTGRELAELILALPEDEQELPVKMMGDDGLAFYDVSFVEPTEQKVYWRDEKAVRFLYLL